VTEADCIGDDELTQSVAATDKSDAPVRPCSSSQFEREVALVVE